MGSSESQLPASFLGLISLPRSRAFVADLWAASPFRILQPECGSRTEEEEEEEKEEEEEEEE
jgi:hypothetical protein